MASQISKIWGFYLCFVSFALMFTFLSDHSSAQTPPGSPGGTMGAVPAVPRSVVVSGNSEQRHKLCLSEPSWWEQEEGGRRCVWGEWDRKGCRRRKGVRKTCFRQEHLADFQWRKSHHVDPVWRKSVVKHISMWVENRPVSGWPPITSCFREADRAILMACQQRGASWTTFRDVSAQLGNRTAKQVRGGGAFHYMWTFTTKVYYSLCVSCRWAFVFMTWWSFSTLPSKTPVPNSMRQLRGRSCFR